MRQAGRYLPEYREIRAQAEHFLEFCLTPDLAVEATLQPIRRFGFDAAILFSDILVVPHALGQRVWFDEKTGPCLEPLRSGEDISSLSLDGLHDSLAPVYDTLHQLCDKVPADTTLIGFAGAPLTVAGYMIEGGPSKDFGKAKAWARDAPATFHLLIDLLVDATAEYLIAQVKAGAEALQLFDTWAGVWPEATRRRWCLEPAIEILCRVRTACSEVPMILFPRGAGPLYQAFAAESGANALSLDTAVSLDWARECLQRQVTLQGNLDPTLLVTGGPAFREGVGGILRSLAHGPFIFNLGHGILPQTPLDHVAELVELVRGWRGEA